VGVLPTGWDLPKEPCLKTASFFLGTREKKLRDGELVPERGGGTGKKRPADDITAAGSNSSSLGKKKKERNRYKRDGKGAVITGKGTEGWNNREPVSTSGQKEAVFWRKP